MDIYCPKCGEPFDLDCLHEEAEARYDGPPYYLNDADRRAFHRNPDYDSDAYASVFARVRADFQTRGCEALSEAFGGRCSTPSTTRDATFGLTRQEAAAAMYDLLGDDTDGAAAMLEDLAF